MHNLVGLVTLVSLAVYFWMNIEVGRARGKLGVPAPATTGHPEFERHFRVAANTLEGLVVYLPALWLFALSLDGLSGSDLGDEVASGLGLVWIVGRIIYKQSYVRDPGTRSLGFGIQGLATIVLLLGAIGLILWSLVKTGL